MANWKIEAWPTKPMTIDEAIEFFRSKVPLTDEEFRKLAEEVRVRAFTVSRIAALDVLKDILDELTRALEEGLTLEEFRQNANAVLEKKGYEGLSPYRADNIFRTNIQTAYSVGRYKQMTDPEVLSRRPYWQYDAVNDERTRPSHLAMDGKVYPADHPFWDTWYPPNGFRCRCSVRSLSERDIAREGLQIETEIPKLVEPPGRPAMPLMPDPGFAYNPGKAAWKPDLSKYPEDLREAYERVFEKGV